MTMDKVRILIILLGLSFNTFAADVSDIEQWALKKSPDLNALKNKALALENQAVAKSQWRDPTLELGASNFPTDTLNINQEPMTQLRIGLKQMIPRGNVLNLNYKAETLKAHAFKEDFNHLRLDILKQVRLIWLQRYYWRQTKGVLQKKRALFSHLKEVTHAMYANNKAPQKAVLNAKLQISKIDERIIHAQRGYQTTTVDLARWVGMAMASKSQPQRLPRFTKLPSIGQLERALKKHPLLMKDNNNIFLSKTTVDIIRQDYQPKFAVGLAYAHRDGLNMNRSQRSDFISVGISIDLPMFPKNRQDRRFKAGEKILQVTKDNHRAHSLDLKKTLHDSYIAWLSTRDELHLYRGRLIPEAKRYADSTLIAYQNNKTDFPTLSESYIGLFNLQLKQEKARFEHAKWKINLLYLQGK